MVTKSSDSQSSANHWWNISMASSAAANNTRTLPDRVIIHTIKSYKQFFPFLAKLTLSRSKLYHDWLNLYFLPMEKGLANSNLGIPLISAWPMCGFGILIRSDSFLYHWSDLLPTKLVCLPEMNCDVKHIWSFDDNFQRKSFNHCPKKSVACFSVCKSQTWNPVFI